MMIWGAYDIHECSNDNVMLYSVSEDNGERWSGPEVFMASPGANVSHAFQLQLRGTDTVLMVNREGYCESRIIMRKSPDLANTWDFGKEIPPEHIVPNHRPPFYGMPAYLLQLESGKLLIGVEFAPPDKRDPRHYDVAFLLSDDEGETWERTHILTVSEDFGAMEPTIVELEPNKLYCFLRNTSGYLYETMSHDGGKSWDTPTKTNIPSPSAMSKLVKVHSGRVMLVWNNQSSTNGRPRYPLVCALSEDGCKSWSKPRIIATESGLNQLSNFGVIQLNDGRILLATSHYHAIPPTTSDIDLALFDERWVMSGGA
jgi:Neuraminidase (sialidase)